MIHTIEHNGKTYPSFQAEGFAAKFAIPFALQVCKGYGYDIGCNRPEWALPGAIPIDPAIDSHDGYDAYKLDRIKVDYIFSSHCLEHLPNWVDALNYWRYHLAANGVLFLYLPDHSQSYWRPHSNRKHIHAFTPEIIRAYLVDTGWHNVFVSGVDLNNSFIAMAQNGPI